MFYSIILEAVSLVISVTFVTLINKLLFPAESYLLTIAGCLLAHSGLNLVLNLLLKVKNFIAALDRDIINWKDGLWFLGAPLILGLVVSTLVGLPLISCVLISLIACTLHTYLVHITHLSLRLIVTNRDQYRRLFTLGGLFWLISIVLVAGLYLAVIKKTLVTYPVNNPVMRNPAPSTGIWYTVPVEKSELFLEGYARFEDSVGGGGDDLGHLFFAVLGSRLGLIAPCDPPYINKDKAIYKPEDPRFQMLFAYTLDILCPAWAATLSQFYWFIGLVGLLFTSIIIGVIVLRDPGMFFLTSTVLLFAWLGWPPSRPGHVDMLVFGLPFVCLIPYLCSRGRTSSVLIWSFICGIVAGLAGFVRSPSGSALLVTSVLCLLFFLCFVGKRWRTAILALLIVVSAQRLVPATLNALLDYRDSRLGITAPVISTHAHAGPGWNLLGGIGGPYAGELVPVYPNALDMAHWDALILLNTYDRNPLAAFGLYCMSSTVPGQILKQYLTNNPREFLSITFKKTYSTFISLVSIPTNWQSMIYLIAVMSILLAVARFYLRQPSRLRFQDRRDDSLRILSVMLLLVIIAALPAILTEPTYFQVCYPAAAILFLATLIGVICFVDFITILFAGKNYHENNVQP